MFEGKEVDKKLGEYGSVSVDITPEMKLRVELVAEVDLIAEAKKLAAKSDTPIDDAAIAWLEKISRPVAVVEEEVVAAPV